MRRLACTVVLGILAPALAVGAGSRTDRLMTLADVWGRVKFFHPYLLYRDIDWDQALVSTIPRIEDEMTDAEFSAAVSGLLNELGDPATRVLAATEPVLKPPPTTLFRWQEEVLIIEVGPFFEAQGWSVTSREMEKVAPELEKAKAAVLDLRINPQELEDVETFEWVASSIPGLSTDPLVPPAMRVVFHDGYRPQVAGPGGGYYTAFLTIPAAPLFPALHAPGRLAFIANGRSRIPLDFLALWRNGRAAIVATDRLSDANTALTNDVDLGGGYRALIRNSELVDFPTLDADVITSETLAIHRAIEAVRIHARPRQLPAPIPLPSPRWQPDRAYAEMINPDHPHRMLALFRLWNVIRFFYPYKDLISDWDAALRDFIPRFESAGNDEEYAKAVLEMVARVDDGHSRAWGHPAASRILGDARIPLEVRVIEDQFVVTGKYQPVEATREVEIGDVLLSVDGEAYKARVEKLWKYAAGATEIYRRNRIASIALRGPKDSQALVEVLGRNGEKKNVRIPRTTGFEPAPDPSEVIRLLPGNIGYVDLRRLQAAEVDKVFETLGRTRAMIFDVRGYPHGTAWLIAPRINRNDAKIGAIFMRPQLSGAQFSEETSPGFFFAQPLPIESKPRYLGQTVMLIDDRTISQAEHTGLFFEAASGTTFVGTHSAGSNGDITYLTLPGGFEVMFTGQAVRHADGRQLQRIGLVPHIEVAPTIRGIRAGRDEVLERAISYLNEAMK